MLLVDPNRSMAIYGSFEVGLDEIEAYLTRDPLSDPTGRANARPSLATTTKTELVIMATTETSGTPAPRHPEDDDSEIFARLARFDELHLRVGADPGIGSVTIVLEGIPGTANADLTLAPRHALSLALALVGAVGRLQRLGREP